MVREPNITKYFLIIVNSLLPLPWDPGLLSNNPPLVFDAVIYYLLYLALFSHLQETTCLYLYEILPWAIVLLQLVNKPFFSSKPPPTPGLNREFMIINILPYQQFFHYFFKNLNRDLLSLLFPFCLTFCLCPLIRCTLFQTSLSTFFFSIDCTFDTRCSFFQSNPIFILFTTFFPPSSHCCICWRFFFLVDINE